MLNSVILDVAIGMAFLYLLLSLIASVVQEVLATFMQLRPANLQKAIRSLLTGSSIEAGSDLVDNIYTHGLVRGLYSDPKLDFNPDPAKRKTDDADQSPGGKFKKFLASLRRADWLRELLRRSIGIQPEQPIAGVSNQMLLPAYIPSRTFALAMIDILNRNKATGKEAMQGIHNFLAAHHYEFRDNKATEAMLALATDAQGDLKKFQENLETWYNAAMDRASGWYKKYTQTILLVLGLALAIIFNVDSVHVTQALWSDRDARQGMVDAATQYMKDHPNPPVQPIATTTQTNAAQSAAASTVPAPDPAAFDPTAMQAQMNNVVQQYTKASNESLLPVGWKQPFRENVRYLSNKDNRKPATIRILDSLPGWLITALAISLGAPFWFDTLNKFMVVRSTVKPQEKSKDEESKS
jgi:hypothetical protein